MHVLVKTRQLPLLSDWARSVMKVQRLTQAEFAKKVGINISTFRVKLHTGMTYADVEKIAHALGVPKPDLAKATLLTLQQEIRDLSGTPEAEEYGIVPTEPQHG